MTCLALLLGDAERLPFAGHLRLRAEHGPVGLALAARVGPRGQDEASLRACFQSAQILREALAPVLGPATDRHEPLRRMWEALTALLDPIAVEDLSLLAIAWDADGQAIAGVGLAAVLGRSRVGLAPLVAEGHPLLAPPGRPSRTPGVLSLDPGTLLAVIGLPPGLELPPPAELDRRCGLRV